MVHWVCLPLAATDRGLVGAYFRTNEIKLYLIGSLFEYSISDGALFI